MQSEDQLDDIVFDYNDSAGELSTAAGHLHQQVERMVSAGALSDDELEHADEARSALADLARELDERHAKETIANADVESIAEPLEDVHALSGDIMDEVGAVSDTIYRIGFPQTDPHEIADDSGYAAQQRAADLRQLAEDPEDRHGTSAQE